MPIPTYAKVFATPSAAPFWWAFANFETKLCKSGSNILKPIKKKVTPTPKSHSLWLKPIKTNAMAIKAIEAKNTSLPLLYFSPKTAEGPIAIIPKNTAGR